jgi:hypothetical protein
MIKKTSKKRKSVNDSVSWREKESLRNAPCAARITLKIGDVLVDDENRFGDPPGDWYCGTVIGFNKSFWGKEIQILMLNGYVWSENEHAHDFLRYRVLCRVTDT